MALQEKAMKVLSAHFVKAAERQKDYPTGGLPEVAFAGRSNVGKSSMINTLLGRRSLVKTSKMPGLTRLLNFYLINDHFMFVDLPGYGYARVPLHVKKKWGPMVETYLNTRKQLAGVVVIMDARRPPTESDMVLVDYLRSFDKRVIVAATKSDKLSRQLMASNLAAIKENIGEGVPIVLFSSLDGRGKKELWNEIKSLIE